MNIFVGKLSYDLTEDEFRKLFEEYGVVVSARIITDRETRESKGFGFVEMAERADAQKAIKELNGSSVAGRSIVVNEARPKDR